MTAISRDVPISKGKLWASRVLAALPVMLLLFSGAVKFTTSPEVVAANTRLGWSMDLAPMLGVLELSLTLLYLIPRTSVLGAILLTGHLGGATATHIRIGDPFYFPLLTGVLLWASLYLREPRLSELVPVRR